MIRARRAARRGTGRTPLAVRVPLLVVPLLLATAVLGVVVAGCGAPEYTYVTNSADRTYVRLPPSWQKIDPKAMDDALGLDPKLTDAQRGLWMEGYDADAAPSPLHLFGPAASAPAAFVGVQQVPEAARPQITVDKLRDLFYPVSARQAVPADPSSGQPDFALISDQVLDPGHGLRGVHTVFRYRMGDGPPQVMDQTVYVNADASKLHMFFVRCSTECYEQRKQEIGTVVSSFTVRESS